MLRQSGVTKSELSFWWQPLGENRGFWHPSSPPTDMSDLWLDIETTLAELRDWETANAGGSATRSTWQNPSISQSILQLSGSERIAFWGFGL
jgi:hypothetical protein